MAQELGTTPAVMNRLHLLGQFSLLMESHENPNEIPFAEVKEVLLEFFNEREIEDMEVEEEPLDEDIGSDGRPNDVEENNGGSDVKGLPEAGGDAVGDGVGEGEDRSVGGDIGEEMTLAGLGGENSGVSLERENSGVGSADVEIVGEVGPGRVIGGTNVGHSIEGKGEGEGEGGTSGEKETQQAVKIRIKRKATPETEYVDDPTSESDVEVQDNGEQGGDQRKKRRRIVSKEEITDSEDEQKGPPAAKDPKWPTSVSPTKCDSCANRGIWCMAYILPKRGRARFMCEQCYIWRKKCSIAKPHGKLHAVSRARSVQAKPKEEEDSSEQEVLRKERKKQKRRERRQEMQEERKKEKREQVKKGKQKERTTTSGEKGKGRAKIEEGLVKMEEMEFDTGAYLSCFCLYDSDGQSSFGW